MLNFHSQECNWGWTVNTWSNAPTHTRTASGNKTPHSWSSTASQFKTNKRNSKRWVYVVLKLTFAQVQLHELARKLEEEVGADKQISHFDGWSTQQNCVRQAMAWS